MTRTEQIRLTRLASRYITIADHCVDTSFATLCIGVPLTLLAFAGFSPWPGLIYWAISWATHALGQHYTAAARAIQQRVIKAREAERTRE